MRDPLDPERAVEPVRTVEVIPRIRAPIDEGLFIPRPKPTKVQTIVRIGLFALIAIALTIIGLTRGGVLR